MRIVAQLTKRLLLLTAIAVALVTPASAQLPVLVFEPGFEAEIWQRLPQLGKRIGPQCVPQWLLNPEEGTYYPNPDIQGDNPETWDPDNPPPEVLNDHPTGILCDSAVDTIPLDEFLFPYDVAVWQAPGEPATIDPVTGFPVGYRIFVSDSNNNRVLAFGPDGPDADDNPDPVTTLLNADWTGRPSSAFCSTAPDGVDCSPTMLVPDGIDVDDAGNVWVADSGNNRILVFDNNGVWQATHFGDGEMYGLDVAPGSAYGVAGGRVAFISIADGIHTSLNVIDAGDLSEVGRFTTGPSSLPNELNISTDVAYHVDADGIVRLAVADWPNSSIKVFQTDGDGAPVQTLDLLFGPTQISGDPDSQLQLPYRLSVDRRGRFLVSDTANQRLAVFKPDFTTNPLSPTVSYLFQLNAAGGLNGFPRGVVEDKVGRLIVADLANHKVEIFQIPDLAVVNATLDEELIEIDSEATVSFSVTVPETKNDVVEVVPVCQVSGPATMLTTVPVLVGAPLGTSDGATLPTIHDREIFRYSCTARATGAGELLFMVGAVGNPGGITVAPTKTVTAQVRCADCESTPPTIDSTVLIPPSPSPNAAGWHQGAVTVRLLADDSQPGDSGIQKVFWRWTGPMATSLVACAPGADYACATVSPSQPSAGIDVLAAIPGTSAIEYWTEDVSFNTSTHGTRQVKIDYEPPQTSATYTGGGIVVPTVTLNSNDPYSGVAATYYSVAIGTVEVIPPTAVPSSGQVVVNVAGSLTFNYWSVDVAGNVEATNTLSLLYTSEPSTVPDALIINEDSGTVVIDVLQNDNSLGLGAFLQRVDAPPVSQGTTAICGLLEPLPCGPNKVTFTPAPNFNGVVTFQYFVGNLSNAVSVAGDVMVTVNPVNDPPVAIDDAATVTEDGGAVAIAVLANDHDIDGGALTVSAVTQPAGGATTGTVTITTSGVSFVPGPDFMGTATFTYTVSDGRGGLSLATVRVTVTPAADPPTALNDTASVTMGVSVTIPVLSNDNDVDGDSLTVDSVSDPAHGTVIVNADGTILYTPDPGFTGTDTFTYTVTDNHGGTATATVTVNVSPATCFTVRAGLSDSQADALGLVRILQAEGRIGDLDYGSTKELVLGPSVTSPAAGAQFKWVNGEATAFSLTYDSTIATFTVGSGSKQKTLSWTVTGSDTTFNAMLIRVRAESAYGTLTLDDLVLNGNALNQTMVVPLGSTTAQTMALLGMTGTSFTLNGTATMAWAGSWTGSTGRGDKVLFRLTPGRVAVPCVPNQPPVANNDLVTVNEDQAQSLNVLANDTDPNGDTLTVTGMTQPVHGTAVLNANGTLTYTPAANYTGGDAFTYTISDGKGGTATARVDIKVRALNDAPIAVDDTASTTAKRTVNVNVLANDTDPDGDALRVSTVGSSSNALIVINADKTIGVTPSRNFIGTITFEYTVSDSKGGTDTGRVTVTVRSSGGDDECDHDHHDDDDNDDHHTDDDECDRDHDHNGDGHHDNDDHDSHHDDCSNSWNGHGYRSNGWSGGWKWSRR